MINVIYIDDDPGNRAVLKGMFQLCRVDMAQAADANTGLDMLEREDYGLVLMDLRMPEMNGLTAIRKVRARLGLKGQVPIVVVTADLTPGVQRLCEDAGANGFLTKPVAMAELFEMVGAIITENQTAVLH